MEFKKENGTFQTNQFDKDSVDLQDLVSIVGYQLTAYIGQTNVQTVAEWLKNGLPENLEARMQATLDVAKPIAEVESELVAQGFLIGKQNDLESYRFPATMLRDADVATARTVLMQRAREEFLDNVAGDLEDVERRLKEWISHAKMPPRTVYRVGLSSGDRLWLELLHAGFTLEQQRKWDRGEDWPCWDGLIAVVPEMAFARTSPDLQTGCPFKYLRRSA